MRVVAVKVEMEHYDLEHIAAVRKVRISLTSADTGVVIRSTMEELKFIHLLEEATQGGQGSKMFIEAIYQMGEDNIRTLLEASQRTDEAAVDVNGCGDQGGAQEVSTANTVQDLLDNETGRIPVPKLMDILLGTNSENLTFGTALYLKSIVANKVFPPLFVPRFVDIYCAYSYTVSVYKKADQCIEPSEVYGGQAGEGCVEVEISVTRSGHVVDASPVYNQTRRRVPTQGQ